MLGERCSEISRLAGEPLWATAPRAGLWLLLEYAGDWPAKAPAGSELEQGAIEWLAAQPKRFAGARTQLIRRKRQPGDPLWLVVAVASEHAPRLHRLELAGYEALATVDLEPIVAGTTSLARIEPLFAVCTHARRDACCARLGLPLYRLLVERFGRERVVECTHVGGHRFAGNLVLLPHGACFGRLDAADPRVVLAVASKALDGEIDPRFYRGRSCFAPEIQAAEHLLRQRTGLYRFADLRLLASEALAGDRFSVAFEDPARRQHVLEVAQEEVAGARVAGSCGEAPEDPVFRWVEAADPAHAAS